jgi:hypothetical protein
MTERLLQYIWQFQHFNRHELTTTGGEPVFVFSPGMYNTNQGPDFFNARIRIGPVTWSGSVELHLHTSDWNKHAHENDPHYSNVMLHVVWEDDGDVNDLPVLELKSRISKLLLQRYQSLLQSTAFIPCGKKITHLEDIAWQSWKDRLLAERLLRKAAITNIFLQQNNFHWEETFWWLLARGFGSHLNADFFESVARSVPLALLARHKSQLHQLEALLLGQAGLLNEEYQEDYAILLQKEYQFLRRKYELCPVHGQPVFLRMRPVNFPTVRLAQLAMLIHQTSHLFTRVKEAAQAKDIRLWLDVTANDYWHYHYRLGELTSFRPKKLGMAMADSIIINTIIPILFAYGHYHQEESLRQRVLQWLDDMPAETNAIIHGYRELGMQANTAGDTQALLELKSQYCNQRKCLDCSVGNALLKKME